MATLLHSSLIRSPRLRAGVRRLAALLRWLGLFDGDAAAFVA